MGGHPGRPAPDREESIVRVFVVEDHPRISAFLRKGLEEEGFVVEAFDDGGKALDALLSAPPDACVLDVMLPGLDGFEVVRRAREGACATPILLLRPGAAWTTGCSGLDSAPTTTSPSRSRSRSWWPGCGRSCGAGRRRARSSRTPTCRSTSGSARCAAPAG
jgi:hypothetical protein